MGGCARTTRCRVRKSGDSTAIPKTPAGCRAPASCRGARSSRRRSSLTAASSWRWVQCRRTTMGPRWCMRSVRTARETSPGAGSSGRLARWAAWRERRLSATVCCTSGTWAGTIHCLDAATGAHVWKHETHASIWGSLLLAGGRLYAGNDDGTMTVLRAGRRKELLAEIDMMAPLYSRPAPSSDALYVATMGRLYLIAVKPAGRTPMR